MIKIKKNSIFNILLFMFPILIAISNYTNNEEVVVILYTLISATLFLLSPKESFGYLVNTKAAFWLFICYIFLGISTVIFFRFSYLANFLHQTFMLFDVIILMRFGDIKKILKLFYILSLILSYLSLIGYVLGIDIFAPIKLNSDYLSIDLSIGGGISTIFEFRHYYAAFLTIALFYLFYFPSKSFWKNFLNFVALSLNLLLTYTRNSWIACIVCILFIIARNGQWNFKIGRNYAILGIVALVSVLLLGLCFSGVLIPVFQNVFSRFTLIFENDTTTDILGARGYSIQYGTKYILKHLKYFILGGGSQFAIEWLKNNPYYYWTSAIDNQYVTIFMNQGIVGIILFFKVIAETVRIFREDDTKLLQLISISVISLFISMMFFEILGIAKSIYVLFLILISGLNQYVYSDKKQSDI